MPLAMPQRLLSVIGVGLLGGSVALAARRTRHWRVRGYDADAAALQEANRLGMLDEIAADLAAAVGGAGLVVLAVPVSRARDGFGGNGAAPAG